MDMVSFLMGFVTAIAVGGVAIFSFGIAAYVKQNKDKGSK